MINKMRQTINYRLKETRPSNGIRIALCNAFRHSETPLLLSLLLFFVAAAAAAAAETTINTNLEPNILLNSNTSGLAGEASQMGTKPLETLDNVHQSKITIIIDEEGPTISSSATSGKNGKCNEAKRNNQVEQSEINFDQTKEAYKRPSNAKVKQTKIDQKTKVIFIDETNESGLIVGQISEANKQPLAQSSSNVSDSQPNSRQEEFQNLKSAEQQQGATNYSLYLISRNKNHIAILIDIEDIDFEPIINCEYQELRFSIVGEISGQILEKKNGSFFEYYHHHHRDGDGEEEEELEANSSIEEAQEEQAEEEQSSGGGGTQTEVESAAPMPVSEAMALLLNAPLNKTILFESEEENDFKVIDSTIDYLYEEACREVQQQQQKQKQRSKATAKFGGDGDLKSKSAAGARQRAQGKAQLNGGDKRQQKRQQGGARSRSQHRVSARRRQEKKFERNKCKHDDSKFKDTLIKMFDNLLEWDDFKIVCGHTRQLIIPMRSLKLSIFSDEFAPSSRFAIRYKFVSDPSLLPAGDNGKYFCRNRNVIDIEHKCDGFDDCGDASDESVKICGYPNGSRTVIIESSAEARSSAELRAKSATKHGRMTTPAFLQHKKRLTYFESADLLHCCQSSEWQSAIAPGQAPVLQSLIGESMKLFSGPLFAPTGVNSGDNHLHSYHHKKELSTKRTRRVKRIVGGTEAHRGAWPGQASLQYELLEPLCHFCAGTLVHPQYVLTAGHCITKEGLSKGIKVVFGAHDLRQLNGSQIQVRYVDDAHIYPGVDVKHLSFNWENDMNNDLALLRLNAPVLVTEQVAPACLPPFNTPLAAGTSCRSTGWGQTHGSGSSNLLKHLPLKVVHSSVCSRELLDRDGDAKDNGQPPRPQLDRRTSTSGNSLSYHTAATKSRSRLVGDFEQSNIDAYSNRTMVCVNNDLGHGICQGDSGGPLYCDRVLATGEHCTEIYGVASFIIQYATVGAMCAVENLPGIFGEVSSKTEWISSTIKMFEQSYKLKYSRLQ